MDVRELSMTDAAAVVERRVAKRDAVGPELVALDVAELPQACYQFRGTTDGRACRRRIVGRRALGERRGRTRIPLRVRTGRSGVSACLASADKA